jgi:hypothetical protein
MPAPTEITLGPIDLRILLLGVRPHGLHNDVDWGLGIGPHNAISRHAGPAPEHEDTDGLAELVAKRIVSRLREAVDPIVTNADPPDQIPPVPPWTSPHYRTPRDAAKAAVATLQAYQSRPPQWPRAAVSPEVVAQQDAMARKQLDLIGRIVQRWTRRLDAEDAAEAAPEASMEPPLLVTYAGAARLLGTTVSALKTRVSRGENKLRACMVTNGRRVRFSTLKLAEKFGGRR